LAYALSGATIVFTMLLLRGGVLILAPIVDLSCRRRGHWFSWGGLSLSLIAVAISLAGTGSRDLTLPVVIDVAAYLGGYLLRLEIMSRIAKSADREVNLRYFAEEQAFASPMLLVLTSLFALIGRGEVMAGLGHGFTDILVTQAALPG